MCALKMCNFPLHCARLGLFFFDQPSVKDDRLKVGLTAELSLGGPVWSVRRLMTC